MAHENIRLQQTNFCRGPQIGTICTIDTTNPRTVLRVKSTAGSTVVDYTLSSNIVSENVRLEYVGPYGLAGMVDGLTFFTFEKVTDSSCMIKRWETRTAYSELLLKEYEIKHTSGNERYNGIDFAVEYYHRSFAASSEYYNYIVLDDTFNIKSGTRLFIGPSSDTDNLGATEVVTVSHVSDYLGAKRVYLTKTLDYQYITGDKVTFYTHVYVYSSEGYAGDPLKGTLFKLDAYTWNTEGIETSSIYKRVTASKWCPVIGAVASVIGNNLLFIRPYNSYSNWRSMFMGNITSPDNEYFPVYDVVFENYTLYKLQNRVTLRNDNGQRVTYNWFEYNYQLDTLLPYTNSVAVWMDQSIVTGYNKKIDINAQVRDQYHVGLRDVDVSFYMYGDEGALFEPLDGKVTTDLDGNVVIDYTSGSIYKGHTEISVKADGSSSSTGSEYVWGYNNVISLPSFDPKETSVFTIGDFDANFGNLRQLDKMFNVLYYMRGYSFYTTPGGQWRPAFKVEDYEPDYGRTTGIGDVATYLPLLYRGSDRQIDAPPSEGIGYGFSYWPWVIEDPEDHLFIGNMLKLTENFSSYAKMRSLTDFLLYIENDDEGFIPFVIITQPDESSERQLSQLKLSYHTHWVDGIAQDELWTYVDMDQFIFVEDAVPKFWSEKNPVDTDIWLRMRPFAFSLYNDSFKMYIRVLDSFKDTGYYAVTKSVQLQSFDAGGGTLGIEATYDPPEDFPYESTVYVKIEVYDTAYIPNFVQIEYWFKITPDYKAPYLDNIMPGGTDTSVPVDTDIYFEVKDVGVGVDIDTLEVLVNSRLIRHESLNIEKVSDNFFKVTYVPIEDLYFSKYYKVTVKVSDLSPRTNRLNTAYKFRTSDSTGVNMVDMTPPPCTASKSRFEDVSVIVLGDGNGVDKDTIRMQVMNRTISPRITPVIYRIS